MAFEIFKKQESQEFFWSIAIGTSWVDSCIWRVLNGDSKQVEVLGRGGAVSWEQARPESLVEAADSSLSAAVSELPDDAEEPNKVVFGVPFSWTQDSNIKEEYTALLKKLSADLELTPIGFVVLSEAIVHYLKSQEGMPPSIILIGLDEEYAEVTLVENGKVLGTVGVGRSMSLPQDLGEALARLPSRDNYPTRFLLYNHRAVDLDTAKQSLLDVSWETIGLHFLHTPKVEVLPDETGVLAVSLAGGAEVVGAETIIVRQEAESSKEEEEKLAIQKVTLEEKELKEKEVEDKEPKEANVEELGFFAEQDIASIKPPTSLPEKESPEETQQLARDKDRGRIKVKELIFGLFPKGRHLFSILRLPSVGFGLQTKVLLGLLVVFLVFVGWAYWFLPQAEVRIFVSGQAVEKTLSIDISKDLAGRTFDVSISSTKTIPTTGTRLIGERATGEVTIYRAGSAVTLPRGTTLTSQNGLKFTLDSDVRVASGSAGPNTLGKNLDPAKVTAVDIGAQYNLAAGTTFKIGNLSADTVTAVAETNFAGGTSREVQAVSDEDRKRVEAEVTAEIIKQAKEKAKATLTEKDVLFEDTAEATLEKKEYDKKVGDESQTLTLNASGKVRFWVVDKSNITNFAKKALADQIPEGFSLPDDQIEAKVMKKAEGGYSLNIVANLLPSFNPEKIVSDIAGKSPNEVKAILEKVPGFKRVQLFFKFRFPGPLGVLPHVHKNIKIDIVGEK